MDALSVGTRRVSPFLPPPTFFSVKAAFSSTALGDDFLWPEQRADATRREEAAGAGEGSQSSVSLRTNENDGRRRWQGQEACRRARGKRKRAEGAHPCRFLACRGSRTKSTCRRKERWGRIGPSGRRKGRSASCVVGERLTGSVVVPAPPSPPARTPHASRSIDSLWTIAPTCALDERGHRAGVRRRRRICPAASSLVRSWRPLHRESRVGRR